MSTDAAILRVVGHPDGAIADFTKATELDPKYAEAYKGRGNGKKARGGSRGSGCGLWAQFNKLKGH